MAAEIITKEDLEQFKKELFAELERVLSKEEQPATEWLRSSQVRALLKISPNTLQNLRVSGKLNYTKIGTIFYYNQREILQLLSGGRKV